jgi:hypothetical protein
MEDIGRDSVDNPIEALLCGHSMHVYCLVNLMRATNKRKEELCPYRCRITIDEEALVDGAAASSSVALIDADAVADENEGASVVRVEDPGSD